MAKVAPPSVVADRGGTPNASDKLLAAAATPQDGVRGEDSESSRLSLTPGIC
ncbi:MAG: hypothetical protein ABSB52_00655 [Acidimicrobiales bacterium]